MQTLNTNNNRTHTNGNGTKAASMPSVSEELPVAVPHNPESVPSKGGAHRSGDPITRRRDIHGNRHPWFFAHSVPSVEDVPLRETALASAIEAIRERFAITAAELEHYYDHKLRPALRRLIAIRDAEESRVVSHNEKAVIVGETLDAESTRVNADDAVAIAAIEASLADAHVDAGRSRLALAGSMTLRILSPTRRPRSAS